MRRLHSVLIGVLLLAACVKEPAPAPVVESAPSFKPVATAKQIMQAIVIPASNTIWQVASEAPKTDEAWLAVENSALALAESGNLLLIKGRAQDGDDWTTYSLQLIDVGAKAAEAVRAKDMEKIMAVGDEMYTVCETCHMKYMPQEQAPTQ
jgi:hypothetical protein